MSKPQKHELNKQPAIRTIASNLVNIRGHLPSSGLDRTSHCDGQNTDGKHERCSPAPLLPPSPRQGWPSSEDFQGWITKHTYREVCIEVVLPVKQGLLVYVTVQCQACHHCSFYTPPVENLWKYTQAPFRTLGPMTLLPH
jgi:hypothetical protein